MAVYGSGLFDNDTLRIDFNDLVESPSLHDVLRETVALAEAEGEVSGEDLESSVLAAAILIDHLIYGTTYEGFEDALTQLEFEASPDLYTEYADKLSGMVRSVSESGDLAEQVAALGKKELETWRAHLAGIGERLDAHYHGSQAQAAKQSRAADEA